MKLTLLWIAIALLACDKENENPELILADYYVSTNGDDDNPGTYSAPFATWQRALDMAMPGDTILIRGGTYRPSGERNALNVLRRKGVAKRPICIFGYPGEEAILDCSGIESSGVSVGVNVVSASHFIFKNLSITKTPQSKAGETTVGFYLLDCNQVVMENIRSYGHDGSGFFQEDCDTTYYINCDAYDNYDLYTSPPGQHADGFGVGHNFEINNLVVMVGCRAWFNSDDGFDMYNNVGQVIVDSCWAFNNGRDKGDGSGFKLGQAKGVSADFPRRMVTNCLAAGNRLVGYNENHANMIMLLFNNSSFRNNYGYGNFDMDEPKALVEYINNISYDESPTFFKEDPEDSFNSWNLNLEINEEDFVSLDISSLDSKREEDGSLPDVRFMELDGDSEFIDAGKDVGLPFKGAAPDLGAREKK